MKKIIIMITCITSFIVILCSCSDKEQITIPNINLDTKTIACSTTKNALNAKGKLDDNSRDKLKYAIKLINDNNSDPTVKQLIPVIQSIIDGKTEYDKGTRLAAQKTVNEICK